MPLPLPFVIPLVTSGTRKLIEDGILWHYTKQEFAEAIVQPGAPPPGRAFGNAIVRLQPPQGYAFDFWKFIRDATVIDLPVFDRANWGRYLYFFLGEPSARLRAMNVQEAPVSIQLRGQDLLAHAPGRVLFRGADKVVVLRGDYLGPALVTPLPVRR